MCSWCRTPATTSVYQGRDPRYLIRFSAGAAVFDPSQPVDIDELLRQADEAMYRHKRQAASGVR